MSTPLNAQYNGTFTTDATPSQVIVSLPAGATEIELINITDWHSAAANTHVVKAEGFAALPTGSALLTQKTGAADTTCSVLMTTAAQEAAAGGFTFFTDTGSQNLGPLIVNAATGITNVPAPVVTSATLPPVGSVVRFSNTTGALQLSGMDFSVTVSGAGTFTLGYVATAPGSAATANSFRVIPFEGVPLSSGSIAPDPRFYPRRRFITGITQAVNAVVTLSVAHSFTAGEKIRMIVPTIAGALTQSMIEMNNQIATILSVNYTTNTITLDIDSSAFTAFRFPTSAEAASGVTFAQVIPVGEAAVNSLTLPVANFLFDATRNESINGVVIGTTCLSASCNYVWIVKRGLSI